MSSEKIIQPLKPVETFMKFMVRTQLMKGHIVDGSKNYVKAILILKMNHVVEDLRKLILTYCRPYWKQILAKLQKKLENNLECIKQLY